MMGRRIKLSTRVSETAQSGPFRLRLSGPLFGNGRTWLSGTVRSRRGFGLTVSRPLRRR